MTRSILFALALIGTLPLSAQLYIPDVNLRVWLNAAKPNSVDVDGYCDSLEWNAQPPTVVTCGFDDLIDGATVDLEGIQYLKIPNLRFQDNAPGQFTVLWPGYPLNIQTLTFSAVIVDQLQPSILPFPSTLWSFSCNGCGMTSVPDFNGLSLSFSNVDLSGGPIDLAASVTSLHVMSCNLSEPPALNNLEELIINDNPLASWGELPGGLVELHASRVGLTTPPPITSSSLVMLSLTGNGLTSFPDPPPTLNWVHLDDNEITALPSLANSAIEHLYIPDNPLTDLPELPPVLQSLYINRTLVSSLPDTLPSGSLYLQMTSTPITVLPTLPPILEELHIDSTAISTLPELPPTVYRLMAREVSQLTCLPVLPQGMNTLFLTGTGVTCLPNIPPGLYTGSLGFAPVVCNITDPCPLVDPLITGTTFDDANGNGVQDVGETVRPMALVIAQPGDLITASDVNGDYVLPADSGSFTVTGMSQLYMPVSTAPYAVSFTGPAQIDSLNHIGFAAIPGIYDLVSHIASTVVRPGFNTELWLTVNNVGTEATTAGVQLLFDAAMTWSASDIAPGTLTGNMAEWNVTSIAPGDSWTVHVTLYAPPSLALGTPVVQQITATPQQADETPADNSYTLNDVVVGSYDPNDKQVIPATLTPAQVLASTRVSYVVRFQNTGTFPAERVLITDTLSTDLQLASIQFTGSSHGCAWYIHHGVLHILFNNINLPDSTSDEAGSHGFTAFSFVPVNTLPLGSTVANIANIYFDYNEPIITNAAVFTVEVPEGVDAANNDAIIGPNPATHALFVKTAAPMTGSMEILDLSGRILMTVPAVGTRCEVGVAALATGSYLVRYASGDDVVTARFVKD